MVCVICLDEEVSCELTPCKVCFSTKFHTDCFRDYINTQNVCPTCKSPYAPAQNAQAAERIELEEDVVAVQHTRPCIRTSDVYHTCMVTQFLMLIVTLAFTPRKDQFEFWTLLLTIMFLVSMHMLDRVVSLYSFLAVCAWITTSCNLIHIILYNHKPIYIAYVVMTCINQAVYATWILCHHPRPRIHPVQTDGALHQ